MFIFLSGEWNTPGESKPVALKCFFRVDQESLPQIEVSFYELNYVNLTMRMLYFIFSLFFYLPWNEIEKEKSNICKNRFLFQVNPKFFNSFTI